MENGINPGKMQKTKQSKQPYAQFSKLDGKDKIRNMASKPIT